jgi:hypothetical protein
VYNASQKLTPAEKRDRLGTRGRGRESSTKQRERKREREREKWQRKQEHDVEG